MSATRVDPLRRERWPVPAMEVHGRRDGRGQLVLSACYTAAVGLLCRLPGVLRRPAIGALARIAHALDRRHAAVARDYIRTACPGLDERGVERRVRAAFAHLVETTLDTEWRGACLPPERLLERVEVELSPQVRELFASGRGLVFATAHCGDWEAAAAAMPWIAPQPLYVVSKPPSNRPLSVRAQALRERCGMRLVPRNGAMAYAPAIVKGGGALALMLDQRPRRGGVPGLFFGRPASSDRSAGVLLKRLRAPIVFAAAWRVGERRWKLVAETMVEPAEFAGRDPLEVVERVNRELERLILREPDQVFWLHDRYGVRRGARTAASPGTEAPGDEGG